MTENRFEFKVVNKTQFWEAFQADTRAFLRSIQRRWRVVQSKLIRRIVTRYLSGRPGLNRISGNASRAMVAKTTMVGMDVLQVWEARGSGASYLPYHEGSPSGGDLVYNHPGTSNGFGKGIRIPAHKVRLPKRTNIFNDITILGDRLRIKAINDAIREFVA